MRVIAFYQRLDPYVVRRIVGPMSILAARGLATHYTAPGSLRAMETANYQALLLPNWRATGTLPVAQGQYIYDLSDPAVLEDPAGRNILAQCSGALCASHGLAQRASAYVRRTVVSPSLINSAWLYSATPLRPEFQVIGCFGRFAWSEILPVLEAVLKQIPARVVSDQEEVLDALPAHRVIRAEDIPDRYAVYMRSIGVILGPGRTPLADIGILREAALGGAVPIVGPGYAQEGLLAASPDAWRKHLTSVLTDDGVRRTMSQTYQTYARKWTAARRAEAWLRDVGKVCPTIPLVGTLP